MTNNENCDYVIEGTVLVKYCGKCTDIIIPYGITEVGERAFYKCDNLQSITIPDSVNKIRSNAFKECKNLCNIVIPDSVKVIEEYAFCGCSQLKRIVVPDSVKRLEKNVFEDCTELNKVIVFGFNLLKRLDVELRYTSMIWSLIENGDVMEEIEKKQFQNYVFRQKKEMLPVFLKYDMVEAIKIYTDGGRITKDNINTGFLEPAIKSGANTCVAYLLNWKKYNIKSEDECKKLERELRKDPYNITDMKKIWKYEIIRNNTIRLNAYKGSDRKIEIPQRIGKYRVSELGDFLFSPHANRIKNKEERKRIEIVDIPFGIKKIGRFVFWECEKLQAVNMPNSIISIGDGAFEGCANLSFIRIPQNAKKGERVFKGCNMIDI